MTFAENKGDGTAMSSQWSLLSQVCGSFVFLLTDIRLVAYFSRFPDRSVCILYQQALI